MSTGFESRRMADQLVKAVEERLMQRLGSYAFLEYRFGVVKDVTNSVANVYLGGDDYASPGFRVPIGMSVATNYKVRVAIDPKGDRWISDVFAYS